MNLKEFKSRCSLRKGEWGGGGKGGGATMFMPSACGIFLKLFFSLNFIALNDILIDLYFICTDSSMIEIGKDFQSNAHAFHYITSYLYSLFRYFDTRKSF